MKSEIIGQVVLTAILAIFAFSVILTPVSAQPVEVWNVTWGGAGADTGNAIATAGDCVYLAGTANLTDAFLNKYDSDGNLLWNSTWGMFAPGVVGGSNDVATAAAGDCVYLAGACGFSNVTGLDAFLNKYDSDGNLLWNITWGGTGATSATIAYATAAAEDCVYIAGETAPSNVSDFDTFLNKYDKDGNLLWNITWGGPGTYSAFATATSGDSVYVAGRAPGGKTFLNRYNSTDGSLMWNLTWKGDGWAIATGENAVYMAGNALPAAFLNKYNSTDGSLIWNITWGNLSLGYAAATGDNVVYFAGDIINLNVRIFLPSSENTFPFLNKYNSTDGSLIWNVTWGKTGWVGHAIATAGDNIVYFAGSTSDPLLANESDAFLVKFSEPTPTPIPTPTPTPIPATGAISVSSTPSGARATIDGLNWVGSTPCITPSDLPPGTYTLRLSLEGYHDWSQTVEVKANKTLEVHATLTPVPTSTPTPSPTPTPPGFEAGFTIAGLLAVAYLVLRRRK